MEKLRLLVFRNCLKRLWFINNKEARMNVQSIVHIFGWMGLYDDDDAAADDEQQQEHEVGDEERLDDAECILANLIHGKFINGYISHKRRILVLSKKKAFPKVKEVLEKLANGGRKSWYS